MDKKTKSAVPPYAPYGPFHSLIKDLRENGVPEHVTSSVYRGSNSGKAMMKATFRYLKLVDGDDQPTEKLSQLTESEDNYSTVLHRIVQDSYGFLFDDSIDLKNTTSEKVAEKFTAAGASGSTISKCVSFFLSAAKDAEIEVSQRVKAPAPKRAGKKKEGSKRGENHGSDNEGDDQNFIPDGMRKFEIPLRDVNDGLLFLPDGIEESDAKKALRVIKFLMEEYYDISIGND